MRFILLVCFVIQRAMTNRIALGLGLFFCALFALSFVFGLELHIFVGRRLLDMINFLAFWR